MKISQKGIDLIKKWESFKAEAYLCPAGVWTQGYGHTRTVNKYSQIITERTAEEFLRVDLLIIEGGLSPLLKGITLSQQQYDAIVSFCFNLGVGAFQRSTAYNEILIDPDSKRVADSWIQYRNAGGRFLRGLLLRRLDELTMYYG